MSTVQQTPQRFLTVADVAATLNCSTDTVRRRIACGDLVAIRLGDHPKAQLRIAPADLVAYLQRVNR